MFSLTLNAQFNDEIPDEHLDRINLLIQSTTDDHLKEYFELIKKSYEL